MLKIISFSRKTGKMILYVAGCVGVTVLLVLFINNKPPVYETVTVSKKTITAEVSVSGTTEAPAVIDLRFNQSGRIAKFDAKIGQAVNAGDVLARLDTAQLDAQIAEMYASVQIQKAKLEQLVAGNTSEEILLAQTKLDQGKRTQATLVKNAYQTLLNSSLAATYDGTREGLDSPIITGTYTCGREGSYKLETYASRDGISIRYSGLESGTVTINNIERPLGSCGLFVSLPTTKELKSGQVYYVNLPNKAGTTYNVNYSAYTQALANEKSTIEQLEAELVLKKATARPVDVEVYRAQIAQAEAALASVYAQKQNNLIVAPIDGTVTNYTGEVGETIGSDTIAVTLMPKGTLQIALDISETKIASVAVGQKARITLDAFPDQAFSGTVTEINPAETVIGGAVYYKAKVMFDEVNNQIRTGMTANVWVETATKNAALAVPAGAITIIDNDKTIRVLENSRAIERVIKTGLEDVQGNVEVVSGLSEGDVVILSEK